MLHGENVLLMLDGYAIAASKECKLDIDQDMIEVCSPVDGRARKYIPGVYEWTAGNTSLVHTTADAKKMLDAIRDGSEFTMTFVYGGMIVQGKCYIKKTGMSGSVGNLCKLPVTIQGSGALTDYDGQPLYYNGALYTGYEVDASGNAKMNPITEGGTVDASGNLKFND